MIDFVLEWMLLCWDDWFCAGMNVVVLE